MSGGTAVSGVDSVARANAFSATGLNIAGQTMFDQAIDWATS